MEPTIRTFQCNVDGSKGLTVSIPEPRRFVDFIRISVGHIDKDKQAYGESVYLDVGEIISLTRLLQGRES
jgi:hypothetical protein